MPDVNIPGVVSICVVNTATVFAPFVVHTFPGVMSVVLNKGLFSVPGDVSIESLGALSPAVLGASGSSASGVASGSGVRGKCRSNLIKFYSIL